MDRQPRPASSRRYRCCAKSKASPRTPRNGPPWQAVSKTVRDLHIRKAMGLQEDISVILTFACLFCAIVAWLVIPILPMPQLSNGERRSCPAVRGPFTHETTFCGDVSFLTVPHSGRSPFSVLSLIPLSSGLWLASFIVCLLGVFLGMLFKRRLSDHLETHPTSFEGHPQACGHPRPLLDRRKILEVALLPVVYASLALFFSGAFCIATASAFVPSEFAGW